MPRFFKKGFGVRAGRKLTAPRRRLQPAGLTAAALSRAGPALLAGATALGKAGYNRFRKKRVGAQAYKLKQEKSGIRNR